MCTILLSQYIQSAVFSTIYISLIAKWNRHHHVQTNKTQNHTFKLRELICLLSLHLPALPRQSTRWLCIFSRRRWCSHSGRCHSSIRYEHPETTWKMKYHYITSRMRRCHYIRKFCNSIIARRCNQFRYSATATLSANLRGNSNANTYDQSRRRII